MTNKTTVNVCTGITIFIWGLYLAGRLTIGGLCESPKLVANFDKERYMGVWYGMHRSDQNLFYQYNDCDELTLTEPESPDGIIEIRLDGFVTDTQKFDVGIKGP